MWIDTDFRKSDDFFQILQVLHRYVSEPDKSKKEIAEAAVKFVAEENERRAAAGCMSLISIRSVRTYERWIDLYLDPFEVTMQREGLAAARKKFGTREEGLKATFPGQIVQLDAWRFHVISLDTTRQRLSAMTADQRKKVKKVRRWVILAIDVATRCIIGYSICRNPNSSSSLEALRMCFVDKTYLLRMAGITKGHLNFRASVHQFGTDSGSEFGKHPFGGALFAEAVRRLTGSLMNTTAGIPELRAHVERWFLTAELKFARQSPGWTGSNPWTRNDRKPHEEACLTDDELERAFIRFIAEYHNTPHRGLGFMTPAGAWEKMSRDPLFDPSHIPGPAALREACGFHVEATVTEAGIRYANTTYSNEFIRNQRKARLADRIAAPGKTLEIMVDPMDLGAISVLSGDDIISVPCLDPDMRGKSLRVWQQELAMKRAEAEVDVALRASARKEAYDLRTDEVRTIMRSSDIGMFGYTDSEIRRAARELDFGKGQHEKPFVGRDEYQDPVHGGFEVGDGYSEGESDAYVEEDEGDDSEVKPDAPNGLDRFRSRIRPRSGGSSWDKETR